MTTPAPRRRTGRPRKVVTDPERAELLLEELRVLEHQIREAVQRRQQVMIEANDLGVTVAKLGEAIGTSPATVSQWVRDGRAATRVAISE